MSPPAVPGPRSHLGNNPRAWRRLALRLTLSVIVLAFLLNCLPADAIWAALERIALGRWLVILIAMAALHTVAAAKWRMLVRAAGVPCEFFEAVRAHGAGLFAGLFLPGLVGTDVVRATLLTRAGGDVAPIAVGSVADRLVDTASLVFLAALGAAVATGGGAYWATPALVFGALVAGSIAARPTLRFLGRGSFPVRVRASATKLGDSLDALLMRPSTAFSAFAISVVLQTGFVLLSMWLGRAVGIDVSAAAWFLAFPLAKLTLLAPVTVGGLGFREAALAALLVPFGVAPAVAVAQGLLWQTLQIGLALLGGLTAWLGRRVSNVGPLSHHPIEGINPS